MKEIRNYFVTLVESNEVMTHSGLYEALCCDKIALMDRHLCHQICFHLLSSKLASDFNSSIGWKAYALTLKPKRQAESFFRVNAFPFALSKTFGFSSCSMIQLNDFAPNFVDIFRSNGDGFPPLCM